MVLISKCRSLYIELCLIMLILSITLSYCSKYSKEKNIKYLELDDLDQELNFENEDRPFRMNKVNLLWTKAKKRLSGRKLGDLYADLKIHDKKEANLKKVKAENEDKDGLKEAEVLSSYNRILRLYDLVEHFIHNADHMENEIPFDEDEKKSVHFQDQKLRSMWRRAEQAGFSDEDLDLLKEEFWHQQMKINEFDFMSREIGTVTDRADNIVDSDDVKEQLNLSTQEKKEKKLALKQQNREIKDGYMKLELLQSKFKGTEPLFKDNRVHYLWALAKKTNWTEEELDSFREELKHFEQRLSKKTYFDEQLSFHDESKEGKSEKIMHLEEKRSDAHQKVKKLHSDLKLRLEKALRHTEL